MGREPIGRIGAVVNPNSGQGRGGQLERWLKLRLGEELDLLELAPGVDIPAWARHEGGIGLEADIWPAAEAVVRRRFRDVLAGPLALAGTVPAAVHIELEGPDFEETVSAWTMTISNVAITGAHLPLAPDADIRDPRLYL